VVLVSVLAGLFDDLNNMSLVQLLLAFTACMSSALALGNLLAPRARWFATAAALATTVAFVATSPSWPNAVMLTAIAIGGLGVFTATVLLLTRLIGLAPRDFDANLRTDSVWPADEPAASSASRARARANRIAST
jgi:Trk-type K+ transport system membrane component